MIFMLIVDLVLVRPRAQIMVDGRIITSHADIMRLYLYPQGMIDAICILIVIIKAMSTNSLVYIKIIFYLKYSSLYAIDQQLTLKLLPHHFMTACYSFLKWISYIVFITNL